MSWSRRSGAILVCLVALATACSSGDADDGGSASSASTTGSSATSSTEEGEPDGSDGSDGSDDDDCATAETCSLAAAGERSDLLIGTAAKLGDAERRELQIREFNALTAEGEFLWSVIHPGPDEWDFERADALVAFAEEHDMDLTATHLLWDPPSIRSVVPDWVREITDPDELRATIRDHFEVLRDRYGGQVDRWNVVNEPIGLDGTLEEANHYHQVLGPGYVAEAFAIAEEVWPETALVLNQDLVEYISARADALVELTEELLDGGARVDRVGLQGHLFLGEPQWAQLEDTMARLAELGVTLDLTEVDIPTQGLDTSQEPIDLETQAEWGGRLVRICLDQPACGSITFWGFDDGDTWIDDFIRPGMQPLPYDADLQPKPMHAAVLEELLAGR